MDNRPIAIFDSGLGGLTALRALVRQLPGEDFVYFGDTGRVPYGGRSRETLVAFARQNVAFLRGFDPKCIVVACGTISTTALGALRSENKIPLYGVVEPAVAAAAAATQNGKIGVIATRAAVASGAYERALSEAAPGAVVFSAPCPLFVPLVENGRYLPGDPVVDLVVADYLQGMRDAGIDTLILGCTHYPLLSAAITQFLGTGVRLIDSGAACAGAVAASVEAGAAHEGRTRGFVSADVQGFSEMAAIFLDGGRLDSVTQVDIEQY